MDGDEANFVPLLSWLFFLGLIVLSHYVNEKGQWNSQTFLSVVFEVLKTSNFTSGTFVEAGHGK
jgi:hypothetical protein